MVKFLDFCFFEITKHQILRNDWEQERVKNILNYTRPENYIVSDEHIKDKGKYPVLTANKQFILGFSNNLKTFKKEAIIFDDFTLDSKFVNFEFLVRSSAIKILTNKENKNLFFAFLLININNFENNGHARHYINIVQESKILIPNQKEQNKISNFIQSLNYLITLHQRKLSKLENIKKTLLEKMFPAEKQTKPSIRFKEFTNDWEQEKVGNLFKITRGFVIPKNKLKTGFNLKNSKYFPVYSSQTQNNGLLGYFENYLFEDAITWTTDGANAGTVNFRSGKFYCSNVCGVILEKVFEPNIFFSYTLQKVAFNYVNRNNNPKLMNNMMSEIVVKFSFEKEEQNKISLLIDNLNIVITLHQRKLKKLESIKKTLLERMFV